MERYHDVDIDGDRIATAVNEVDMPGATQGGDHKGSLRNVGLVMGAGAAQQCPGALRKSERQVCTMGQLGLTDLTQRGRSCMILLRAQREDDVALARLVTVSSMLISGRGRGFIGIGSMLA
jgi:hypothetical protein